MSILRNFMRKCAKPTAIFLLLVLSSSIAARAQNNIPPYGISSSVPYRQSGVGNATGRSGSATMTARALLGKDGNTTVELSTGTLDSSTPPPGSFGMVQFKPLDPSGNVLFAQNFTPLSTSTGYYSFNEPYFYRGQQVQLQGNITGIDANRTDVVTVFETVKLRPDLAVQKLTYPVTAIVNQAIPISANIVELNGDTGATTACVLAVDGNNVDQAQSAYVDAAGSVTCLFSYKFASTGNHTIQVSASNVVPADWDSSNNSSSGSIAIVDATADQTPQGVFEDDQGGIPRQWTSTNEGWQNGSLIYNTFQTFGFIGEEQHSMADVRSGGCAGSTNAVRWEFPLTLSYTENMDGNPAYSLNASVNGSGNIIYRDYTICNSLAFAYASDFAYAPLPDHQLLIGSTQYYDTSGNVIATFQDATVLRQAGDITYYSYGFQCDYGKNCDNPANYYSWNSSGRQKYGTLIPVGSTWTGNIAIQDVAGRTFAGSVNVPLTRKTFNLSQNTCYDNQSNGVSFHSCLSYDYDVVTYLGTVGLN